ncbi:MAG TPA: 4-(cytidine 5'-diphospho)-2-C-methyl-D-erythritol kinase [Acidimicrobiales bacterium]
MNDRDGTLPTERAGLGMEELSAPAKLTLSLQVTGVRSDGYHLLRSEMVSIDLADTLWIGDGSGLTVSTASAEAGTGPGPEGTTGPGPVPVGPDNLVTRALAAVGRTARVDLVKRIPVGAGLGGGSADAAAVLRWAGCWDPAVAVDLGADVPFCLSGGRASVSGIGEEVTPLPYQERRFTLLLLPFGVDTGAVYRAWDRMAAGCQLPAAGSGSNDLEAPALHVEPRLARWRTVLEQATGRRPRLAGSGSTWFVEGGPDETGLGGGQTLRLGEATARLVPVRTTRPAPRG